MEINTLIEFIKSLEPGNWTSLIGSCLSVIISIIIGICNLAYTQKQFIAVYYPNLNVEFSTRDKDSLNQISLKLKNLSKDKSVINCKIKVILGHPLFSIKTLLMRRVNLIEINNVDILPEEEKTIRDTDENKNKSIEQILLAYYPWYIELISSAKANDAYYIRNKRPINIYVYIKYQAGFSGTKNRVIRKLFKLQPDSLKHSKKLYRLNFWRVSNK